MFIHQLKQLSRDTRFILCACSVLIWWLVLPSVPGCHLVYLATPWGQASILFLAALLLWIRHPVSWFVSIGLSGFIFYLGCISLGYAWAEVAFLPHKPFLAWGEPESWGVLLFRFVWSDLLVCALAACIAAYAGACLAANIIRRRSSLP